MNELQLNLQLGPNLAPPSAPSSPGLVPKAQL